MTSRWKDSPERYGLVTRTLHWGMAALFAWQFMGMAVKLALGRSPVTAFLVGTHVSVGSLLFVLIVLRVMWGMSQARNRGRYQTGWKGRAAAWGHLVLYVLMLVVPLLAVIRQIGSGKGYRVFGLRLVEPTGTPVEWMIQPAQLIHGTLAWILLVLIGGHLLMVGVHRYIWRDTVTDRMIGRSAG